VEARGRFQAGELSERGSGLFRNALTKAGSALISLAGSIVLVFLLLWTAPGDPALLALRAGTRPARLDPTSVDAFRKHYGLDKPAAVQLAVWTRRAFSFDFGRSIQTGEAVSHRLRESIPVTASLNAFALFLSLLLALPAAGLAASRGPRTERFLSGTMDAFFSTPPFVTGLLLILVFSSTLGWTPVLFSDSPGFSDVILPALSLALATSAPLYRFFFELFRDALEAPCSLAARARGEGRRDLLGRSLRRSGGAVAALGASLVPSCLAGSVLVEKLFSIGGAGSLLADSVSGRDYPVVLALTFLSALAIVVAGLLAGAIAVWLDPRLRAAHGDGASE
jgi:peptide/nickel transport system permease protein